MNQSEIEIKYILELIPSKLFKKLKILNISTAKEVMDIDLKEFSQIRGIGPTVIEQLQDFQETIHEDINSLIDLQLSKTREYILPIDFEDIESESFIEVFKETINDYLNLLDDDKLHKIISYSYGLNDLDKYTTDELAIYFENSSERIRQLKNEILNRLDKFLSGQKDENLRCKCENEISKHYLEIKSKIIDQKVLSKVSIYELVSPKTTITENFSSLIDLLIDVLGIHRCGKVETIFTTAEILILDKFQKKKFIKTAESVLKILKKEVAPLNEMQVIIKVRKRSKTLLNLDILKAINILPEIEMIQSGENHLYQVKFENLSRASDRAYRILLENSDTMYIDDIVAETNRRLIHSNAPKIYDRHSLTLASDNRFSAHGKTGFWSLKSWKRNSVKIETLIKNALYKLDKPSTYDEIFELIKEDRPNILEKSMRALVGRDCLKVEEEKWILPEWKQKYSHLIFSRRKKREVTKEPEHRIEQRLRIIEYLENKESNCDLGSNIIKALQHLDRRYTPVSFYKTFEQEEYFKKTIEGNKILVKLKQTGRNDSIALDLYNWQAIKPKLKRDLTEIFHDSSSPNYSFDLNDSLELFNKLINFDLGQEEFRGLDQRILGNLNKYYLSAYDSTDKLNYLKQFLTCLDPILKKILFIVNYQGYTFIKNHKKGLGDIIDKLDKLDPTKERFKDERTARKYRFGKHMRAAYFYRNNDAHTAKDWTEIELANSITSCFVIYLFACSEYYNEIDDYINAA